MSETTRHLVLSTVSEWWRDARHRWRDLPDVDALPPEKVAAMALELGITDAELKRIVAGADGVPLLLGRRLAALGLDPGEVAALSPLLLADLKRSCNACAERDRCIDDMKSDPLAPGWESYCPNAGTLASLQ